MKIVKSELVSVFGNRALYSPALQEDMTDPTERKE